MSEATDSMWKESSLAEIYDFKSGLSKARSEFGSGDPFLTFKDVFYNIFTPDELGDLVNSSEAEQQKCDVKAGDVFLTRTSETMEDLGMSCVALNDYPRATFNGFTKRLRPKNDKIVPKYAAYYFRSPTFRQAVTSMSTLSTRASLNNDMLARLTIRYPSKPHQRIIGGILKTLDDKIEMNRRMNETLEAMARAIFQCWFVNFEPVKAKAAGATSFTGMPQEVFDQLPASFEPSELGEIPAGWEARSIAEIAEYVNGKAFTKHANDSGRMIIRIAELNSGPGGSTKYSDIEADAKHTAYPDDILFSWSGSLNVYRWHRDEAIINQHIFKVIPDKYPPWFIYFQLVEAMPFFQAIASTKATTMGHIKRAHLSQATFANPSREIIELASTQMRPLYNQIHINELQTSTLTRTRDALLPKLLSGEIVVEVPDE